MPVVETIRMISTITDTAWWAKSKRVGRWRALAWPRMWRTGTNSARPTGDTLPRMNSAYSVARGQAWAISALIIAGTEISSTSSSPTAAS